MQRHPVGFGEVRVSNEFKQVTYLALTKPKEAPGVLENVIGPPVPQREKLNCMAKPFEPVPLQIGVTEYPRDCLDSSLAPADDHFDIARQRAGTIGDADATVEVDEHHQRLVASDKNLCLGGRGGERLQDRGSWEFVFQKQVKLSGFHWVSSLRTAMLPIAQPNPSISILRRF